MTRQSVLNKIKERIETKSIKILGSRKDREDALYIIINSQSSYFGGSGVISGLTNETLKLLKEAEIKYEIIK